MMHVIELIVPNIYMSSISLIQHLQKIFYEQKLQWL